MKIALVRREFAAERGGAERYAVALARGLVACGHEVHIIAGSADPAACPSATVHRVPFLRKPSALKNVLFQKNVRRFVAQLGCDIVHGLSQIYPQDVYRVGEPLHLHWLITRTPTRLLRLALFFSPRHQVILCIERNIFKEGNYRRIIVNSRLSRLHVMHYYGVPDTKVRLVYNGVDHGLFYPDNTGSLRAAARERFGLAPTDRVLAFVANDFKRKGLACALNVLSGLRRAGYIVRLIVAGRGSKRQVEQIASALHIGPDIIFAGCVAEPQHVYHAADLVILPTLYDPFANVCLEAMACGIPVLTTRCNGASELIEHGMSGFVVERPEDVDTMADILARFFDAPADLRTSIGRRASEVADRYTLERNVERTLRVYDEILREKQRAL